MLPLKIRIDMFATPGCEACNIMTRIIKQTVELYTHSAYIDVVSHIHYLAPNEQGVEEQRKYNVKDFPTTRFYVEGEDKLAVELEGTYPKDRLVTIIENIINSRT